MRHAASFSAFGASCGICVAVSCSPVRSCPSKAKWRPVTGLRSPMRTSCDPKQGTGFYLEGLLLYVRVFVFVISDTDFTLIRAVYFSYYRAGKDYPPPKVPPDSSL